VLGDAGIYPVVAGAAVAAVLFLFVFVDAPSQYLTVVALGGIAAVSVAGGIALFVTH
jgi:ABC-type Fe3+-siderophore transport system permease subunit